MCSPAAAPRPSCCPPSPRLHCLPVSAAIPGTLNRIFALIAKMKLSANFTEAIGTDLGIIGSEDDPSTHPVPKFTAEAEQGATCQCVSLKFFKYGHMGVYIESRRGTGAWEFLAIDTESPYEDERRCCKQARPKCANTACASGTKARPTATGPMW